jgi:hypothetical protein
MNEGNGDFEPSPTAEATRLMLPPRTSPTANTPGRLVSSRWADLDGVHPAADEIVLAQIGAGLDEPLSSSARHLSSHRVFGTAPVIMNTWRMSASRRTPRRLSRHVDPREMAVAFERGDLVCVSNGDRRRAPRCVRIR